MRRSRKERDSLFARYEGLAIRVATDLWNTWEPGLRGTGTGLDDLCQDARAVLLELCDRMDRRRRGDGRPWLVKSLRGRLFNLVKAKVYPKVQRVQADLSNFPDEEVDLSALLPDISLTFNRKTREFCQRILDGDSETEARRAVGWTKVEQREAMARLRREKTAP